MRADHYLQGIGTWPNNASRAQGPERWLVDQGIIHHLEAQARRAGVYELKIAVTTQGSHISHRPSERSLSASSAWYPPRNRDPFSIRLQGSLSAAGGCQIELSNREAE